MIGAAFARRKRALLVTAAALVVAVVVAGRVFRVSELAEIGAGYTAQQTCACLFIGGRTLESCMTDLEPLARRIVRISVGERSVTAGSLPLFTATARFERGLGCTLEN